MPSSDEKLRKRHSRFAATLRTLRWSSATGSVTAFWRCADGQIHVRTDATQRPKHDSRSKVYRVHRQSIHQSPVYVTHRRIEKRYLLLRWPRNRNADVFFFRKRKSLVRRSTSRSSGSLSGRDEFFYILQDRRLSWFFELDKRDETCVLFSINFKYKTIAYTSQFWNVLATYV